MVSVLFLRGGRGVGRFSCSSRFWEARGSGGAASGAGGSRGRGVGAFLAFRGSGTRAGGSGGAAGSRRAGAGRAPAAGRCVRRPRGPGQPRGVSKVLSVRSEPALMGLLPNFLGTAPLPEIFAVDGVEGA